MSGQPVKLSDFGLDEKFGYMQHVDPVTTLPPGNEAWDEMGKNLPKHLMGSDFRQRVKDLPPFRIDTLKTDGEIRRAFLVLSYIGQAYQWSARCCTHPPWS